MSTKYEPSRLFITFSKWFKPLSKVSKRWKTRSFKFNYPRDIWISNSFKTRFISTRRRPKCLSSSSGFPNWKWLETWKKIIRRLEIGIRDVRFEKIWRTHSESLKQRALFHSTLWLSKLLLKWSFDWRLQWDGYHGPRSVVSDWFAGTVGCTTDFNVKSFTFQPAFFLRSPWCLLLLD